MHLVLFSNLFFCNDGPADVSNYPLPKATLITMVILPLPKELSCSFHVIKRESNQGMSGFYFERKKHHHSLLKNQQVHGPQNAQKPWLVLVHPRLDMMPLQGKLKTHVILTGNAILFLALKYMYL